jgi:hypothetical protein
MRRFERRHVGAIPAGGIFRSEAWTDQQLSPKAPRVRGAILARLINLLRGRPK